MDVHIFLATVMLTVVFISTSDCAASNICWDKTWYNNSNPVNGSEFETLSKPELAKVCPYGAVIGARCADDKFEGFSGSKTDKVNLYVANCSVASGLVCHPFKNTSNVCPDMAIQYGCECPTTSGIPTNGSVATRSPVSTPGLTSPAPRISTDVSGSTGSPADPNQRQKQSENGHNNGIKNERHSACLLFVLLIVKYLY